MYWRVMVVLIVVAIAGLVIAVIHSMHDDVRDYDL
jgi:hypothetical protein